MIGRVDIRGVVERIVPHAISGWCVDLHAKEPATVELRVDSVLLMTVRADIHREDIDRALRQPLAGFRFPISPRLRRFLPHEGSIEVSARGIPLRVRPDCDPIIDNPAARSMDSLLEKLQGGYVITPKYGHLFRPLKKRPDWQHALAGLESCRRIFREVTGKDLFICYGTLLGHIRDDDIIEHDDDIDLCFLADSDGWQGALREFVEVINGLQVVDQRIHIDSTVQFHWYMDDYVLDIFMGWMEGDYLNMHEVGGILPRNRLLPLRPDRFLGQDVLVPNDSAALLRLIYGEGWRTPDPNFQWRSTPAVAKRMRQYKQALDDLMSEQRKRYWSQFYEGRRRIAAPSSFAASVATELAAGSWIVDVGCGDGRDSFFFASLGHRVLGLDAAGRVIESNNAFARGRKDVSFREADVSQAGVLEAVLRGRSGAASSPSGVVVYGRFFFHAIAEGEEGAILQALAELPSGARCFFEFRTTEDAGRPKRFGGHYRRYIDVETFIKRAGEAGQLDCCYRVRGRGMAKYGEEDPIVARVHFVRR